MGHYRIPITPWPSTTSLGPLNSTKRAGIAPHRALGITFTTLYGTPGSPDDPIIEALSIVQHLALGAYKYKLPINIMGHWRSPYDPLLPLMEHCRGIGVRGFSHLVLQLIFNDLWVVLGSWGGPRCHARGYKGSRVLFNGLWVVLEGPVVVFSATLGATKAIGVLFDGLWVILEGPVINGLHSSMPH